MSIKDFWSQMEYCPKCGLFGCGCSEFTRKGSATGGDKHCYHTWQEYRGFKEDYLFCTKCDAKAPILEIPLRDEDK